jgi:hypothetical protein
VNNLERTTESESIITSNPRLGRHLKMAIPISDELVRQGAETGSGSSDPSWLRVARCQGERVPKSKPTEIQSSLVASQGDKEGKWLR